MNLVSCDECGVVIDVDKNLFPSKHKLYKDDGTIDHDRAAWDGQDYTPKISCPVCDADIVKDK